MYELRQVYRRCLLFYFLFCSNLDVRIDVELLPKPPRPPPFEYRRASCHREWNVAGQLFNLKFLRKKKEQFEIPLETRRLDDILLLPRLYRGFIK